MPGAYAHLSLVNAFTPARLDAIPGFPKVATGAFLLQKHFAALGAVGPDYPYLAVLTPTAAKWADAMHYTTAGQVIANAVDNLRGVGNKAVQGKLLAWLLGYAAHVGGDMTIHPIVFLKVGPYEQNKREHRICEMHQDAYIFPKKTNLSQSLSEYLDGTISRCGAAGDASLLDGDVAAFWLEVLGQTYPALSQSDPADPHAWHSGFAEVVDAAEESGTWPSFARHVAANVVGMAYPREDDVSMGYITDLAVPGGTTMHYDDIFARAVDNIAEIWGWIVRGVYDGSSEHRDKLGNWNLDTGDDGSGRILFWEQA